MLEIVVSVFLLLGAGFALIGSFGLAKLPDFFTRLHGPSKATTLGLGGMLIAAAIHSSFTGDGLALRPLLITLFLFITAPVSAHLLARSAIAHRLPSLGGLPRSENKENDDT
jgi:multicomponent K+:H+ antiporter subunit G